jgi:two-component system, chemotaxis family, sensor kinase CheA
MATDEELLKRLLAMFRVEAQEHIQAIVSGLIPLEKASTDAERLPILDVIFRSAHSLKGAARAVNLGDIEAVCQAVENMFAALKKRQISASPNLFDLMHRAVDLLGELASSMETGASGVSKSRVTELVAALRDTLQGKPAETPANHLQPPPVEIRDVQQPERSDKLAASGTVRIPVSKLDAVLL